MARRSNRRRSRATEEVRLEMKRWDIGRGTEGETSEEVDVDVWVEKEEG